MKIAFPLFGFLLIALLVSCNATNHNTAAEELYKSTDLTPVNSFTSGAEGPAVDKAGNLYAVNYSKEGTVGMITPSGKASIFIELPNGSVGNGIRFNSKGEMLIADYTNHNILMVDMMSKQISVYAHDSTMNQPNDIAIDSKDRLYASDPNWKANTGCLWRIDTDGKIVLLEGRNWQHDLLDNKILSQENMGTTNGIEVSPDEKTLYVNESMQRKVWAYDLSANGAISNKRLLIEFPDFGMDGMRCDVKGNLYIARWGKGVVAKVSPKGELLKEITLTGKKCSNLAFGGVDGKTVYVTLQDRNNIETFKADAPGREWKMIQ